MRIQTILRMYARFLLSSDKHHLGKQQQIFTGQLSRRVRTVVLFDNRRRDRAVLPWLSLS